MHGTYPQKTFRILVYVLDWLCLSALLLQCLDYSRADWDGLCDHLRDVP